MSQSLTEEQIGKVLKGLLEEQGLTLKQLSACSNIDIATISRIINGKRAASIHHLEALTECLDVSLVTFFELTNKQKQKNEGIDKIKDSSLLSINIKDLFDNEKIDSQLLSEERLMQEHDAYKLSAGTQEGEAVIDQQFLPKLERMDGQGHFIQRLKELYKTYQTGDISNEKRVYIGAALLYVIAPIDLIPDMLFPIGYLDDALLIHSVSKRM